MKYAIGRLFNKVVSSLPKPVFTKYSDAILEEYAHHTRRGNISRVTEMTGQYAGIVNQCTLSAQSRFPLSVAIEERHFGIADLLLENGAATSLRLSRNVNAGIVGTVSSTHDSVISVIYKCVDKERRAMLQSRFDSELAVVELKHTIDWLLRREQLGNLTDVLSASNMPYLSRFPVCDGIYANNSSWIVHGVPSYSSLTQYIQERITQLPILQRKELFERLNSSSSIILQDESCSKKCSMP